MQTRRGDEPRTLPSEPALRVILRRLREIMAEPGDGQSRLDKIVRQISGLMVAEVCSIYLKRQDGSLELFGGTRWKEETFHRVQRVDTRAGHRMPPELPDFQTRRVNLTFRYVPDEHVTPFARLSPEAREDVRPYMRTLAEGSAFFRAELEREAQGA